MALIPLVIPPYNIWELPERQSNAIKLLFEGEYNALILPVALTGVVLFKVMNIAPS